MPKVFSDTQSLISLSLLCQRGAELLACVIILTPSPKLTVLNKNKQIK